MDVSVQGGDIYVDEDLDGKDDYQYSAKVMGRGADISDFSYDTGTETLNAKGSVGLFGFDEDMPPPDAEDMARDLGDDEIIISKNDGGPAYDVTLTKVNEVRRLIRMLVREEIIRER